MKIKPLLSRMRMVRKRRISIYLIVYFLAFLLFLIDFFTPLGYEEWIFYLLPISLLYRFDGNRKHYDFTGICTILIIVGFLISPKLESAFTTSIFNRIFGISLLWGISYLLQSYRKVMVNVSELKQAEQMIIKEKAFSESAINSLPGVFYLSVNDGNIVRWNLNFEKITGYTSEEIKNMKPLDLFGMSEKKFVEKAIERVFSIGSSKIEANLILKNGKPVPFYFSNCRMHIDGVPYLIGSGVNISRRKRIEEMLKAKADELEYANKELEAFSYSASHDLKAPLMSIIGFTSIIKEDYASQFDSELADYLERIISSSHKMERIIEDIFKLSKLSQQGINKESINLSEVAYVIINDLKQLHPDRKVDVIIKSGLIANVDKGLFTIALTNLIGNAWKYSGKVEHAEIEFGKLTKDKQVVYFVRDNGAGFNMNQYENLFSPFKRLHSDTEFTGTGIGLAIVERVIHKHGGEVWAESEPGKGATFYFTL